MKTNEELKEKFFETFTLSDTDFSAESNNIANWWIREIDLLKEEYHWNK
jgi:hypothetical protein